MATWTCTACSTAYAVGAPACPHCGATTRTEQGGGSVLPTITVTCATTGCLAEGVARRVMLRPAAVGLVEVPRLLCVACGTEPKVLRPWPQEGEDMAKITVHGGPSNAAELPEREPVPGEPLPELPAEEGAIQLDPAPGEEESSPGTTSSPSSEREPTKPAPSGQRRRSRARTTANRSKTDQTASPTAARTDGDQTEPTSATAADG
jgi:hypothetical protein